MRKGDLFPRVVAGIATVEVMIPRPLRVSINGPQDEKEHLRCTSGSSCSYNSIAEANSMDQEDFLPDQDFHGLLVESSFHDMQTRIPKLTSTDKSADGVVCV